MTWQAQQCKDRCSRSATVTLHCTQQSLSVAVARWSFAGCDCRCCCSCSPTLALPSGAAPVDKCLGDPLDVSDIPGACRKQQRACSRPGQLDVSDIEGANAAWRPHHRWALLAGQLAGYSLQCTCVCGSSCDMSVRVLPSSAAAGCSACMSPSCTCLPIFPSCRQHTAQHPRDAGLDVVDIHIWRPCSVMLTLPSDWRACMHAYIPAGNRLLWSRVTQDWMWPTSTATWRASGLQPGPLPTRATLTVPGWSHV
jgi:hypothetical protein